ncbi:hypothetical protein ACLESO_01715 [Pyxidicoccus sp. 3LG]
MLREELVRVSTAVGKLERAASTPRMAPSAERWARPELARAAPPVAAVQSPPAAGEGEEPPATAPAPAAAFDATAMQAHVESLFQAESAESGWASEAQREVRDGISSLLPSTASVRALDCRASLCRLEVAYSSEEEFRQVMGPPGAMGRLWRGPSMVHLEKDPVRGTLTAVSYLVRPGHPMPTPPSNEAP